MMRDFTITAKASSFPEHGAEEDKRVACQTRQTTTARL